jgi:hypothetical protein
VGVEVDADDAGVGAGKEPIRELVVNVEATTAHELGAAGVLFVSWSQLLVVLVHSLVVDESAQSIETVLVVFGFVFVFGFLSTDLVAVTATLNGFLLLAAVVFLLPTRGFAATKVLGGALDKRALRMKL